MQRLPRQRRVERRVEKFLDPCGIQIFGRAIPCIAQRPDAPSAARGRDGSSARTAISRVMVPHSAGARSRASFACQVPAAGGCDLREPEIRRAAVPLARVCRDASIGRDQRELAFKRLLGGEKDPQRRAFPGRDGEGMTAISAASSQVPAGASAREATIEKGRTRNAAAISETPLAAAKHLAGNNSAPLLVPLPP